MSTLSSRKIAGGHMRMVHTLDPKKELASRLGDLPPKIVMFNSILVAIYTRPDKTAGGIILPDKVKSEDVWQGAAGLVVAMGPKAYKDDETTNFDGEKVEIGDWVWFRASDGLHVQINGVSCRQFRDERHILGVIPDPDYVY